MELQIQITEPPCSMESDLPTGIMNAEGEQETASCEEKLGDVRFLVSGSMTSIKVPGEEQMIQEGMKMVLHSVMSDHPRLDRPLHSLIESAKIPSIVSDEAPPLEYHENLGEQECKAAEGFVSRGLDNGVEADASTELPVPANEDANQYIPSIFLDKKITKLEMKLSAKNENNEYISENLKRKVSLLTEAMLALRAADF